MQSLVEIVQEEVEMWIFTDGQTNRHYKINDGSQASGGQESSLEPN